MVNAVVADKIRAGRADTITLGELATLNDDSLKRAIPSRLVRNCVRSILSPSHGLFYRAPVYLGIMDAFLEAEGTPVRMATPEVVERMIDLADRGEIFLDLWAPHWNFFKPVAVVSRRGPSPTILMKQSPFWLAGEVRQVLGGDHKPVAITVERDREDSAEAEELEGNWVCFMNVELARD
jgi:hypothetical protein